MKAKLSTRSRPTRGAVVALVVSLALVAGCEGSRSQSRSPAKPSAVDSSDAPGPTGPDPPLAVVMPDLIGLPSAEAGRRLGELELSSSWERPVAVRCGQRPRTVAWQRPAAGTPVTPRIDVRVRTSALDLEVFRGPCRPRAGNLGPLHGSDARLAREFYRFAADPALGAPFAGSETWVGLEAGPTSISLNEAAREDLGAWELDVGYAEASGPFSALDTLAASGGYYELRRGVAATCPRGNADPPPHLADARALSLTAPADVTSACAEWWGVTLFLDPQDRIRGVALRLGSP